MHDYTFGIEEEYFVVDRRTSGLKSSLSKSFMKDAGKRLGPTLSNELLQSQIEVSTRPLAGAAEARAELLHYRTTLADSARHYGLGIIAAGSHPFGRPGLQQTTDKRRYREVIDDLGMTALCNPLCGMHVHVAVPDPHSRIDLMNRLVPYLPILLALSTSSPFWAGAETGLMGYRNASADAMPRSGYPDMFETEAAYRAYVDALVAARIIKDESFIWWMIRPAMRYPTLELRITDCCTSVDDAVAIASLYRLLVRHLVRHPTLNRDPSVLTRALSKENRWRAQRYGTDGRFLDIATNEMKTFRAILDGLLTMLAEDIAALGLEAEMKHLRTIPREGTSAHRQLRLFHDLRDAGRSTAAALREVGQWLRQSTEAGSYVETDRAKPLAVAS